MQIGMAQANVESVERDGTLQLVAVLFKLAATRRELFEALRLVREPFLENHGWCAVP